MSTVVDLLQVKPWSQDWLIAAGAYPGFCSMKRLEEEEEEEEAIFI